MGNELAATAPVDRPLVLLERQQLDISDMAETRDILGRLAPSVVINAAAYTAVDRAESEADRAAAVNADGPGNLARGCAELGADFLQVSTDFVFDGRASTPYTPDSPTGPISVYGSSKLAGERAAREALPATRILRTGWVYSAFGANFVKTMLRLMAEREQLAVVADQIGTPTWARGLAEACWAVVAEGEPGATYHWSDAGACSWYDFAVAIAEESVASGQLARAPRVKPIPASEYPTPARRPSYSVLDKSRCWQELGLPAAHWRVQLRAMLKQYEEHEDV